MVGGTAVAVGSGVLVGGTAVSVGRTSVAVGGTAVSVGGGGTGVFAAATGAGVAVGTYTKISNGSMFAGVPSSLTKRAVSQLRPSGNSGKAMVH